MFEVYKAIGSRKTYLVFDGRYGYHNKKKEEALKLANSHYKTKIKNLDTAMGWVVGKYLYFDVPPKAGKIVFIIYKKR